MNWRSTMLHMASERRMNELTNERLWEWASERIHEQNYLARASQMKERMDGWAVDRMNELSGELYFSSFKGFESHALYMYVYTRVVI